MTPVDALGIGLFLLVLGAPVWLTGRLTKRLLRRRTALLDTLAERGTVHTFDIPLMLGVVIFGAGAVLQSVGLVPGLIWLVDGDAEARRVFLVMWPVFAGFCLLAWVTARPGLRIWVSEPTRVIEQRVGIAHRSLPPSRRRVIPHDEITGLHERRSVLGALSIRGSQSITVPMQMDRFDEFVSAVRAGAPDAPYTSWRDQARRRSAAAPAHADTRRAFAVPRRRVRATLGFLGALLAFFCIWPWFLVTGDHVTRDSFIFTGIGIGLWAVIAGLVAAESFPRGQPSAIELRPGAIAWRTFRSPWQEHDVRMLATATVETDIIYVRGFPGYRHPLLLVFLDGTELRVDDARARHLHTSTHQLGEIIRAHANDLAARTSTDEEEAKRLQAEGDAAAESPEPADLQRAIERWRAAIATHPSPARRALHRRVADIARRLGDHRLAVSHGRAFLDDAPSDAAGWEGLAAAYRGLGREDLAGEATQTAERLLLNPEAGRSVLSE